MQLQNTLVGQLLSCPADDHRPAGYEGWGYDPQTGAFIDPQTGTYVNPATGYAIDPDTGAPCRLL